MKNYRKHRSFGKKFRSEETEELAEDALEAVAEDMEEAEVGNHDAEDIATLIMVVDEEELLENDSAVELVSELTGLTEESIEVLAKVKQEIVEGNGVDEAVETALETEEKEDEDDAKETVEESRRSLSRKIDRMVRSRMLKFNRSSTKMRTEEELDEFINLLDEDIIDFIDEEETADMVADLVDDDMIEIEDDYIDEEDLAMSRRSRFGARKGRQTIRAKRRALLKSLLVQKITKLIRAKRRTVKVMRSRIAQKSNSKIDSKRIGNLHPKRVENQKRRKIDNNFNREENTRPKDAWAVSRSRYATEKLNRSGNGKEQTVQTTEDQTFAFLRKMSQE